MKLRTLIPLICSVLTIVSCASDNTSKSAETGRTAEPATKKDKFETGQIINKVVCKSDSSQSYSLYLPAAYSTEKSYPVVYAFDPHADGHLPVSLYRDLAEHYGYIIIGSNNSKNGNSWEESQAIATALFADVTNRISINTQRVYLLGFSGGARVANSLTIINGAINSVICCGASAPVSNGNSDRNNYCFMGIVGNEDFNYTEMKKYDMVDLAGHNVKHSLIVFGGKHEWPAKAIMDEAFWWLELNEMRKNSSAKNDAAIKEHLQPLLDQLQGYTKKNEPVKSYELCRKIINFYEGLADLSACYQVYKTTQNTPEVNVALKQEERNWGDEAALRQQYINAFQTKDLAWWNKDIAALNKKIKTEKDTNKVLIYKRVLSFLSLAAFMQTNGALNQKALPAADFFSKIYVLVDPNNSDAHYLVASIHALQGDSKQAIKSLSMAVKSGFSDSLRLKTDPAFSNIRNTKEFNQVVNSLGH
jgi:hypothetical protein